jgi:hypothetical protein
VIFVAGFALVIFSMRKQHDHRHRPRRPEVGGKQVIGSAEVNPVLKYQADYDEGIHPAVYRDPIRIPDVATGPGGLYGGAGARYGENQRPYGIGGFGQGGFLGPIPGRPMGVPVPQNAMRDTNERMNRRMSGASNGYRNATLESFGSPFGLINGPVPSTPFYGSVDAWAPFRPIGTDYEKVGILTSANGDHILNLFRRPIAPVQELWEYAAEDKNGFFIRLNTTRYLEDGDLVHHVDGKAGMGPWTVHMYVTNKYIWV